MRIPTPASTAPDAALPGIELIAQRIVKLAEVATLEHLEALMASQAGTLLTHVAGLGHAGVPDGRDDRLHHKAGISPSLGATDA